MIPARQSPLTLVSAASCIVATGKAWLARGGNLYVFPEVEARGAARAKVLDSPKTWVYRR